MEKILIEDDDGHWYLIDLKDREIFENWINTLGEEGSISEGRDFTDDMLGMHPCNAIVITGYRDQE